MCSWHGSQISGIVKNLDNNNVGRYTLLARVEINTQKCSVLLTIHIKKFYAFNLHVLTEQQNFITIETFANYGMVRNAQNH